MKDQRRWRWYLPQKATRVRRSDEPQMNVSQVARRMFLLNDHGLIRKREVAEDTKDDGDR